MNMLACPFCGGTKLSIDRKSVLDGYNGLDGRVERHTYSVRCHFALPVVEQWAAE